MVMDADELNKSESSDMGEVELRQAGAAMDEGKATMGEGR